MSGGTSSLLTQTCCPVSIAPDLLLSCLHHREEGASPCGLCGARKEMPASCFTDEETKFQSKKQSVQVTIWGGPPTTSLCVPVLVAPLTNCTSLTAFFPTDAAFLAREKAKADAECYTAMKIAEANKVKVQCCLHRVEVNWGLGLHACEF